MAQSERFEVELPAELAAFVHAKAEEGGLASDNDVFAEAVHVLQLRDTKLQALRSMVEASIAAGGSRTDDEVAAAIEARIRTMLPSGN